MFDKQPSKTVKVSFVCAFNNQETLDNTFLASLKEVTNRDFEVVLVDGTSSKFNTAAEALNWGANKAKGEILVFAHQDVKVCPETVDQIIETFENFEFGIGGVAGISNELSYVESKVFHGESFKVAGKEIYEPKEVSTLDECFFFIKREDFLGFDNLGKTWHFYAVDYSLKSITLNKKVMIFPIKIYHLSDGFSLNKNYFKILTVLAKKYQKTNVKYIHTTIVRISLKHCVSAQIFYWEKKLFLHRKLKQILTIFKK